MSGEFSGIGLAIGSAKGARSFKVDPLGRLTGIHYAQVWKPGENEAICLAQTDPYQAVVQSVGRASLAAAYLGAPVYPGPGGSINIPRVGSVHEKKPAHNRAACQCGFYAFYDGSDDYQSSNRISAVVEGYGETVIGTRGFRAEKARILALYIPKATDAPAAVRKRWPLTRWFARHQTLSNLAGPLATGIAVGVLYWGLVYGLTTGSWWALLAAGAWSAIAGLIAACSLRAIGAHYDPTPGITVTMSMYGDVEKFLTADLIAKVRRNYPDVPVFDSFADMVKAFPTDKGLEPSPENDSEFWERNA